MTIRFLFALSSFFDMNQMGIARTMTSVNPSRAVKVAQRPVWESMVSLRWNDDSNVQTTYVCITHGVDIGCEYLRRVAAS